MTSMKKVKELVTELHNILSELENDDDTLEQLEKATNFFCSTWDKCEGYKHALHLTLVDQVDNHIEDLTAKDLKDTIAYFK